jgi:hypothetical protein
MVMNIKSMVFWDVMLYSLVWVPTFGRNLLPSSSDQSTNLCFWLGSNLGPENTYPNKFLCSFPQFFHAMMW